MLEIKENRSNKSFYIMSSVDFTDAYSAENYKSSDL